MASAVVESVKIHAPTGNIGDGKIFVLPVEDAILLRSNQQNIPSSRLGPEMPLGRRSGYPSL